MRSSFRHDGTMARQPDDFEQSARIVESFAEGEFDERVLELLSEIAQAIRDRAVVD